MVKSAHVNETHSLETDSLSSEISTLLNKLGWNRDDIISWYKCRVEESHIVPRRSQKNRLKFHQRDQMKSSLPFYVQSQQVVSFVSDPAQATLNQNAVQKLPEGATYVQLAELGHKDDRIRTLGIPDLVQREKEKRERESQWNKTREEILADERDYKRRRKTYRTKNSHKKAIEIQRDMVEGYMNDLELLKVVI